MFTNGWAETLIPENYEFIPLNTGTVEPPTTDPPTSGQPLYNGHWLWHRMKLL